LAYPTAGGGWQVVAGGGGGSTYLLEIVGYWRPEYLRKKFWQVQQADCKILILAISGTIESRKAGKSK
jgi:predicted nuclease of restriction endonuclease-like RecB superfamily